MLHLVPNPSDDEKTEIWHRPARLPAHTPPPTPAPVLEPPPARPAPVRVPAPTVAPAPGPARRRWPRRLVIAAVIVAALVVAAILGARALAEHWVRSRALGALAARLDRPVSAGDIDVYTNAVVIRDLAVGDLAAIDNLVVYFTVVDLGDRAVRIDTIDVRGVDAELERADVEELLERLAQSAPDHGRGVDSSSIDLSSAELVVRDLTIAATDPERELSLSLTIGELRPTGAGAATLSDAAITLADPERPGPSRLARLLAANPVAGVSGTVSDTKSGLALKLAGHFAGAPDQRFRLATAIGGAASPEIRLGGESVALDRVLTALALLGERRATRLPLADTAETLVGGDLVLGLDGPVLSARGTVELDDLAVADPRLASGPIDDITGTLEIDARLDRAAGSLEVERGLWRPAAASQVSYQLSATAHRAPRRLTARLVIPETGCASMLASVPPALVPALDGFELEGRFSANVELAIDMRDLEATVLRGSIGIDGCRVRSAPEAMSADRLRGSFEHTVPVGGGETRTYVVGPENPNFVPVERVSRHLIRSLLTTEDGSFYRHRGFRTREFRTALIKNLERGRFAYGASSISMQMVKNVMLDRAKTVSRKLQELFLTWYVEGELPKKRILEIYLNAIEFGPGLYGIKPAARQYFGKHPRRINPVEAAFFSSILPAPRRRFRQYCRGYVGGWTRNKIDRVVDRMFDQKRLDPDQYLTAIETPLVFRGNRRRLCRNRKGVK